MPELPEVETVRRQLEPHVVGTTITTWKILDPRWCAPLAPREFAAALVGRRIHALRRRGKYLDWALDDETHVLMHLRMTGTLLLDPRQPLPHTRVEITLDGVRHLRFVDPRRFGTGQLVVGETALQAFYAARLGVEPFDVAFTPTLLRTLARGRRAPIKAFLLDQRMIAGIGNIYADEALFRTGVHPLRAAGALRPSQYKRLRDAIREVLADGIDAGGARRSDPDSCRGPRRGRGSRRSSHRRAEEPCPVCGTTIRKLVVGTRGTYVCVRCQPAPRVKRVVATDTPR